MISILLTTMLVFNYAISNVVYATGSADGANQTSTQSPQEQGTSETEEQSTENSQENENDTDVTNDTSQQESDGSDEDSNTSLSTQSFISPQTDTDPPYIVSVVRTAVNQITFTFNEDLEERAAATTVDHWGLTTYETQLTPSVNNGLRDVGSTIVGNQVILEYTPSVAGSGFYYYVPLTTDPIVDLAGNHLAEITAANKLPFYLLDHTVDTTNSSGSVIKATFDNLPIGTNQVRSRLSQLKIKSTSNVNIRGANEYGIDNASKIRLESVDVNDPNYNFKDLKTLQFEYNDNSNITSNDSLFFFTPSTQKTGRITIRQFDGVNASLAIFTDETTKDIVCLKGVFASSYHPGGLTPHSTWRKYHIKILDTGWEFYVGNNKKTTYDCGNLTTERLLTTMPLDLSLDDIYLFSASSNGDAIAGWVRNIYLADHDIPVDQTDHTGESFIFSHLGETTSITDASDPVITYNRYSPYPYELYSYSKEYDTGTNSFVSTTDEVVSYIESAPVVGLESISISSDNVYSNGEHATTGDTISLEFTATSDPSLDPVVLIGGQTPVRDTTVIEPDFKYTLVVDASTAEGVGSEILAITLVNDFDVANSPDLSAVAFSIATSTPVITTANVNSSYSLTTVTATSDVPATMLQKSIGTGSPCDELEMSTGTTAYTSGTALSYADDAYNGFRVCFSAVTTIGATTYKVSDTIIGLDTGSPEITISTPSTDPEQSKTFSATATDATATTWIYKVLVSGTTCDESALATDTVSYTEGDDIVFSSENDNGYILCFKATDEASFISYKDATISDIDTTDPTLLIETQVSTPTKNPNIQISSTEAGTVVFSGDCGVSSAIQISDPAQGESKTLLSINLKDSTGGDFVDGTYNCSVVVTDTALNTSTSQTINTFVVDNTNPTFSTVKIYSNNSTNNAYAKKDDIITINIIASEALTDIPVFSSFTIGETSVGTVPTFSINTNTPNTYVTTYTVLENDSGVVSFSFTGTDETGNPSAAVTQTTDGSSLTVDNSELSFTLVEISSNNTNTSLAKQGDIITLTAEASGALGGVPTFSSFAIEGTSVNPLPTFADDGDTNTTNRYVTTYTVTSTDNGLVTFSFTGTNLAGTTSGAITTTTNSSSVIADTTNPDTPTETTPISTPTNDETPTVVVNVKEDGILVFGGDCKGYAPDDTSVTTGDNSITFKDMLDATYANCTIKLSDSAGNESTALTLSEFVIDNSITDIPTITTPIPTQTDDKTPTIEVSVTSDGTLVFGGSCKDYAPDDTSVTSGTNSITFKLIPDGTYTDCSVLLRSTAGTDSVSVTLPSFTIDAAKPTFTSVLLTSTDTTNDPYAKQGETVTLTVTANETLTSAPTFSSFAIGGTDVTLPTFADDGDTNTTNTYIATYTVQSGENGVISFSFTGTDLVSNTSDAVTSTTNSSAVKVDTTNPKTDTISVDTTNPQPSILNVNVTFSESVENVTTSNFGFFNTSAVSFGEVESVTVYDSSFTNSTNSTTDTATSLAGRYFKVLIKLNEDIDDTYTFTVLAGSIVDDATNTFETSSNDSLSVAVDTERKPTLTSVSDADPSTTLKTGDFEINVEFSEVVYDVNKNDFQLTDGLASVGTITQVEAADSNFNSKDPSVITTDDTTVISGRYFIASVDPDEGLLTESAVTYTFEVLSSEGITDGVPNSFDGTDGATTTLDITIDTLDPQIISSEIVNSTLVLTSSLALDGASVTGTGGFTVTGSDSTVYTVSSVVVSGTTITITLDLAAGTVPKKRGTYSYRKDTALNIKTSSNNALAEISSDPYGPDFTLDLDGSETFVPSQDAFFLYLYTQTGATVSEDDLTQAVNGGIANLQATKDYVDEARNIGDLDFDKSESFVPSQDAFFLYLYTQTGATVAEDDLTQAVNGGIANLEATKGYINSLPTT